MGSKVNAKDIGSPLIDEKGRVVGVLGRACMPIEGKPCAPVAYGVPVSAIKSFLKTVPADAVAPAPWLGIQGASESTPTVKGVRVLSVAKGSPASEAKLKGGEKGVGDMIVAVAGQPVTTPEELAAAVKKRAIGEKVPMTLVSKGLYKQVDVVLKAPPEASKPAAALPPPDSKPTGRTFKFATPPSTARLVDKIVDADDPVKAAKKAISKAAKSDKPGKTKVKVQVDKDPFGDPD